MSWWIYYNVEWYFKCLLNSMLTLNFDYNIIIHPIIIRMTNILDINFKCDTRYSLLLLDIWLSNLGIKNATYKQKNFKSPDFVFYSPILPFSKVSDYLQLSNLINLSEYEQTIIFRTHSTFQWSKFLTVDWRKRYNLIYFEMRIIRNTTFRLPLMDSYWRNVRQLIS